MKAILLMKVTSLSFYHKMKRERMPIMITYEILKKQIGVITLNRPDAANALSRQLLHELNRYIHKANQDENIRCILLTGSGEKAFCAGADLKERKQMSDKEVVETVQLIGNTVSALEKMDIPTIAVMNGVAFGGGLELALGYDIRIMQDNTQIGLTETSLGIIPGAGGTQRLARLIGVGQAKRLIFTASSITSKEAYSLGIIEEMAAQENLFETALKRAETIATNAPIAVQQAKRAINKGIEVSLQDGLIIEHQCYAQTIETEDRLEGLRAFSEKRKPTYVGK